VVTRTATHSFFGVVSAALALIAAGVHLWAGWEDEHRLVLHPVGHLTVLAAMAWLLALVVAVLVAVFNRRGRTLALSAIALCIIGMLMLLIQ
jgi:uncharacterized protein involved in cysteine biosynthesis